MHIVYRQTCRVCGSSNLKPVIDLGEQYLQGSFLKPGVATPPMRKLPTQLVRCDVTKNETACGLLQMAHTLPPEILYANYWYRSGTNETMRAHLAGITKEALALLPGGPRRVLDIGCNDGTLLNSYPADWERFGVDPSDIAQTIGSSVTVVNTVFPSEQAFATFGKKEFDIVTSIAMFYDLESPVGFARGIAKVLKEDGVWALEMSYLPLMLKTNSFDTICHEHLEYYSLAVLEYIAASAGLRVFRASLNDINGGSIRCWLTRAGNTKLDTKEDRAFLQHLRLYEFDWSLDTDKPYIKFQAAIERLRTQLFDVLRKAKADGKTIHVYGASTKGNVLLQWYGIDGSIIECAADRNPDKAGAYTLGTNIPIVDEATSRAKKPGYYLVLPWHFKAEFLERERETIMAGTGMIFPLPEINVVTKDNYEEQLARAKEERAVRI